MHDGLLSILKLCFLSLVVCLPDKFFFFLIVEYVSFRCVSKWISYTYAYIHSFSFFSHKDHYRVFSRVPWAIYRMYFYFIYSNVHMSFPISQIISSLHDLLCLEQFKVSETKRCLRFYSPGEER